MIKYIILAIILFILIQTTLRFKHKEITRRGFFFWLILWFVIGVAAFLPHSTDFLAKEVGVGRGLDLLIVLSIVVIFYLLFRIMVKIDWVEKEITDLVRKIALERNSKFKA